MDAVQKGVYAASVATLAERIGLPSLFVDLRHEATHANLPSLPLLRLATNQVRVMSVHVYVPVPVHT